MTPAELRRIAEAATSGPWTVEQEIEETDFGKARIFSVDPVTAFSWYDDSAMAHIALDTLEEADAEFIATFNPERVLEMIDENERLRDQNARLMAGNHTAAERQDWRKQFMDTHDDNLALRARLRAQNLSCQTGACGECGTCKRAGIEDEFTAMEREIHQLRARLAAVEKLHTPVEARAANGATITVCQKCAGDLAYVFDGEFNWPCDDIKAARGE